MLNVLFPRICRGCGAKLHTNEAIICTSCRHQLPIACFHRNNDPSMKNLFYGRIPVEQATALLRFQKKGLTQTLLHQLKYRGGESIGRLFGIWLGNELRACPPFQDIDVVIPVPMHKKKLRKRGYNQVSSFGKALSESMELPFREDILIKALSGRSQVFRKRWGRFENEGVFQLLDPQALENQHVLLVDDIVTTGATLEKCAVELLKGQPSKLSLATIAIA